GLRRAAAAGEPAPLVVADAVGVDADGFALAGWVRDHPHLARAVVLLLSSANFQWAMERCRALGATHVRKPVRRSDLAQALRTGLGSEPAATAAAVRSFFPEPAAPVGRRLNILVVEDNPFNQRVAVLKL